MKLNKVLLLDDDEIVNAINKIIIRQGDFAVETIEQTVAEDVIRLLKEEPEPGNLPDLIFLDLNMPVMDGWKFLDEFAKLEFPEKKPKVVLLTSSINPVDQKRANDHKEVTAFISKPLSLSILKNLLDQLVASR